MSKRIMNKKKAVEYILHDGERVEISGYSYRVEYIKQALLCYGEWIKEHGVPSHL